MNDLRDRLIEANLWNENDLRDPATSADAAMEVIARLNRTALRCDLTLDYIDLPAGRAMLIHSKLKSALAGTPAQGPSCLEGACPMRTPDWPTGLPNNFGGLDEAFSELGTAQEDNALGLEVTVDHRGEAGVVHVRYRSLDQLDEIVRRLERKG